MISINVIALLVTVLIVLEFLDVNVIHSIRLLTHTVCPMLRYG